MTFFGIDLVTLITAVGYAGIFFMVFAESGLLFGIIFPGDSLLFVAGFLAFQGFLSLPVLIVGAVMVAILGDSVGYAIGRRYGTKIFSKEDSLFFNKRHIARAHAFYERHGGKTIVLARFVHFVRTFAPILAGVAGMRYRTFLFYNIFGGVLWGAGVPFIGYYFGGVIPDVDRYLLPIIGVIAVLSLSPAMIRLVKMLLERRRDAGV